MMYEIPERRRIPLASTIFLVSTGKIRNYSTRNTDFNFKKMYSSAVFIDHKSSNHDEDRDRLVTYDFGWYMLIKPVK